MDIEDAHKLKLLTTDETRQLFLAYFSPEQQRHLEERMTQLVDDVNARLPEVDDVYGKATGGRFAWPDFTPPPRVEESPVEEAPAAEAGEGAAGGDAAPAADAEKKPAAESAKPEPPPEEAPKPKKRTSPVDMLAKKLSEIQGYPIPTDLIMQQAKQNDMTADEFARAKLAELGVDLEDEGIAPPAPKPDEPAPAADAGPAMVGSVGRAGGHELDAVVEERVVNPVRELQVQARDCYWLCDKVVEGVSFAPVPPESPLESYEAALGELGQRRGTHGAGEHAPEPRGRQHRGDRRIPGIRRARGHS